MCKKDIKKVFRCLTGGIGGVHGHPQMWVCSSVESSGRHCESDRSDCELGEELMFRGKAPASLMYVPPGAGTRVGLTEAPRSSEECQSLRSPLQSRTVFSSVHPQGLAPGGHSTGTCRPAKRLTPFTRETRDIGQMLSYQRSL